MIRAFRRLARAPGFTLAAAATLGLGAASVLLAVRLVDVTLLRPLPGVEAPDELLALTSSVISAPAFRDFEEAVRPLATMAAFQNRSFVLNEGARTEPMRGVVITGPFFELLGVRAEAGRLLGPDDDRADAPPAVVLSAAVARDWMGGAGAAVGRVVRLNGAPFEVVGVADPRFRGPQLAHAPGVWISLRSWAAVAPTSFGVVDLEDRTWSYLNSVLRPLPGVAPGQVAAALEVSAARLKAEFGRNYRITLSPAALAAIGVSNAPQARAFSITLLASAGLVLLLAAVNVAGLFSARVEARRRELATRRALGAGRARLMRELVAEALVLGLAGAAVGSLIVLAASRALAGTSLPGGGTLASLAQGLDGRFLVAALAVAALAALLCAAAPALPLLRGGARDVASSIRGNSAEGRPRRLAASLVSAQVALCLLLLVGAGLFARAARRALTIDLGFDSERIAVAQVDLGLARYDAPRAIAAYAEARTAALGLPGVEAADWLLTPPLVDDRDTESITVPGYEFAKDEFREVDTNVAGPDALRALGVRLVAGRFHEAADSGSGAGLVGVVNEAFVRRYLKGDTAAALGLQFQLVGRSPRIVGVVADTRWRDLVSEPTPTVFLPLHQVPADVVLRPMTLVVRARAGEDPRRLTGSVERTLRAAASGAPVYNAGTFEELYAALLAPQRFGAAALGVLSLLGLALSATGVFALVSFATHRRLRELGIRAALGAQPRALVGLLARQGLRGALVGIALGLPLALAAAPALRSWLYGVAPFDPLTFAAAAAVLLAATLVAALLPARRAARVDPSLTLRQE